MKKYIYLLIIILPIITLGNLYKSNIINLSYSGTDTIMVLVKDQSLINIVEITSDSAHNINSFEIIGLNNYDNKNFNNDEATPEGIYFINEIISIKDYNNSPTPTAAVLTYPNPADIYNKRSGNNVWIQNQTATENNNKSCFYLKNNDLEKLISYCNMKNTPILILKTLNRGQNNDKFTYWENFIETWKRSFGSKMLVSHFNMYITETDNIDFDYAKTINDIISTKGNNYSFNIDNVIILSTPDESIASFQFSFTSDKYSVNKTFSLSLLPIENEWKILSENANYTPLPIQKTDQKIKEKVYNLIKAWENRDFDTYISFYNESFSDGRRNYNQYYDYKKRSFRNTKEIRVLIDDLKIQQLDFENWLVTFNQDYWTNNYQDYGKKEVIFKMINNELLIVKENWSEIKKD